MASILAARRLAQYPGSAEFLNARNRLIATFRNLNSLDELCIGAMASTTTCDISLGFPRGWDVGVGVIGGQGGSLWQPDPSQGTGKTRVGAQVVERGIDVDVHNSRPAGKHLL